MTPSLDRVLQRTGGPLFVFQSVEGPRRAEFWNAWFIGNWRELARVLVDNYAIHKTPSIRRWLLRHPRFHLHFTPTGGSWLNLVERWLALLTEKRLRRGVHRSTQQLEDAIRGFLAHHNRHPFVWTKTADQILQSVAHFCKRISNSDTREVWQ